VADTELCARCGAPVVGSPVLRSYLRLCPRHLEEARANTPPFACTDADFREGETADEECPACGHAKRAHGWDGCEQHIDVFSYGEHVHSGPCGCREWDPMCTAVESSSPREATVTAFPQGTGAEGPLSQDSSGEGRDG
jgi:hypothetical protein